ncbi:MAG: CoA transferase, partial [Pseudomonadota bacterium]
IVIAGTNSESLDALSIGYEQLRVWNPNVILTTISGFGSFGPHSDWQGSHLVNCAVGGWANFCGTPDREPLQAGGAITETLVGAYAAAATLIAAFGRLRHGGGEHIDVSAQEAVLAGASIPTLMYEYRGALPTRYSSVGSGAGASYMLETSTGYIGLNALTRAQWRMLCAFLDRADIADDPYYATVNWSTPDDRLEEIRGAFQEALAGRTAEELFHAAAEARVPFGLVPDLKAITELLPHQERQFFTQLEHPDAGVVPVPGVPFVSTVMKPRPYRPPLQGEHTSEVLEAIDNESSSTPRYPEQSDPTLPLEGIRVLDLSMFFAGPVAAQIAADMGADVIKIESVQRIDGWRGSASGGTEELPAWEASPFFNWVNRNKRDVTLNLTDRRGQDILKHLVRDADVLIENFTPRVMANFGLDYEVLKTINPKLVMISLSGFGAGTSWRDYVAFGMSTEQMSGVSHLTGYENNVPMFTGMTGGDLFAGVMGITAVTAALHHREHTGEGQHMDFSQLEACTLYLGDAVTGWTLAGVDRGRTGNGHLVHAPHGIYRCTDDRWIAISCQSDTQWQTLCDLAGWTSWQTKFGDAPTRRASADEIDAAVSGWTSEQNHIELMRVLQERGVPAGAVMNGPELLADPQLAARGSFLAQDRPGLGIKHYPNQPFRLRNAPSSPVSRAPLLGEHTEEVLATLVGVSDDELTSLRRDDIIGTVPLAARR